MILMLEDDADRIARFEAALRAFDPAPRLVLWRNAWTMVREVEPYLPAARLIALDHDLEPEAGSADDPGDGMVVARFLAGRRPVCPVLIHSSNVTRSTWMAGELDLGGWRCRTAAPIGERWIEEYWIEVVRRLLG